MFWNHQVFYIYKKELVESLVSNSYLFPSNIFNHGILGPGVFLAKCNRDWFGLPRPWSPHIWEVREQPWHPHQRPFSRLQRLLCHHHGQVQGEEEGSSLLSLPLRRDHLCFLLPVDRRSHHDGRRCHLQVFALLSSCPWHQPRHSWCSNRHWVLCRPLPTCLRRKYW